MAIQGLHVRPMAVLCKLRSFARRVAWVSAESSSDVGLDCGITECCDYVSSGVRRDRGAAVSPKRAPSSCTKFAELQSHKPMPDGHLAADAKRNMTRVRAALTNGSSSHLFAKVQLPAETTASAIRDIAAFDDFHFARDALHNTHHARPTESCPHRPARCGPPFDQSSAPAVVGILPDCHVPAIVGRRGPQTHSRFPCLCKETRERSRYV
jgi:hypothetical protein